MVCCSSGPGLAVSHGEGPLSTEQARAIWRRSESTGLVYTRESLSHGRDGSVYTKESLSPGRAWPAYTRESLSQGRAGQFTPENH